MPSNGRIGSARARLSRLLLSLTPLSLRCLTRARLVIAVLVIFSPALPAQTVNDVELWLDRMNVAVEQLNYRGDFVHVVDGNPESLTIGHRYADGVVHERISSVDEDGREILRSEGSLRSTFPEQRLVVVEDSPASSIPVAASLNYTSELENYYQMTSFARGAVAGRETQGVSILARDGYRYSYLLLLDRETALPLRVDVRDENQRVIESMLFTRIEYFDSIPEYAVQPSTDVEGFTWREPLTAEPAARGSGIWGASRVPGGFRLAVARESLMAGSRYPVQHLVYTDGLATVSVFIAHPDSDADMPQGFSRFGATNAYSLTIDGRLATAMGEVPSLTVQRIATSLDDR